MKRVKAKCYIINKLTGEVEQEVYGIANAAKILHMTYNGVIQMMQRKTLAPGVLFARPSWDGYEDVTGKSNRPVRVVDMTTGESTICLNAREAARIMNIDLSHVRRCLLTPGKKALKRYMFEYVNEIRK